MGTFILIVGMTNTFVETTHIFGYTTTAKSIFPWTND